MIGSTARELDGEVVAEHVVHVPGPLMRPYVRRIVGYRLAGFTPAVHRGLPSRSVTFIVSLAAPLVIGALPDGQPGLHEFDMCVGGLHTTPVDVHHDGAQHGLHLEVTPAGARALFGMPAAELASTVVQLDALWGPRAAEFRERLAAAHDWSARFAAIEHVLVRAISDRADRPTIGRDLAMAWQRLVTTGGGIAVAALAAETGWSRRHFTQRFSSEFGLTPKTIAKVMRFERSRSMLMAPARPRLADIAAACGYADQAHMARDWREFARLSPTEWQAAEELPFVHDQESEL